MYLPWHQRAHRDNKAKILLADDNFDMREYVARLLSAKYEVISVSNGSLFRACLYYSIHYSSLT